MKNQEFVEYCKKQIKGITPIYSYNTTIDIVDEASLINMIHSLIKDSNIKNISVEKDQFGNWDGIIGTIVDYMPVSKESINLIKKLIKLGDKISLQHLQMMAQETRLDKNNKKTQWIKKELKKLFLKEIDLNYCLKNSQQNPNEEASNLIYFLKIYEEDFIVKTLNKINNSYIKIKVILKLSLLEIFFYQEKTHLCNEYFNKNPFFLKLIDFHFDGGKYQEIKNFLRNNNINYSLKSKNGLDIIEHIEEKIHNISKDERELYHFILQQKTKQEIENLNNQSNQEFNL